MTENVLLPLKDINLGRLSLHSCLDLLPSDVTTVLWWIIKTILFCLILFLSQLRLTRKCKRERRKKCKPEKKQELHAWTSQDLGSYAEQEQEIKPSGRKSWRPFSKPVIFTHTDISLSLYTPVLKSFVLFLISFKDRVICVFVLCFD